MYPGRCPVPRLEDNQRRLQRRLTRIEPHLPWPSDLELHTQWPRLDQGGIKAIEQWIATRENVRLIIVDTLAVVRPQGKANDTLCPAGAVPSSARQTSRGFYYQAEIAGVPGIDKTKASYARVQHQVLELGRQERLSYRWIADATRQQRRPYTCLNIEDALEDKVRTYRRSL